MNKALQSVPLDLVETQDIQDFIPLLQEIELGDKFLLSMLHWCGIGKRSSPLPFWQVYVARSGSESIGVCGLYRQQGMDSHVCWVGWLGVRPKFRLRGFGSRMVRDLKRIAVMLSQSELWVYTGSNDPAAIAFYEKNGFRRQGKASVVCPGKTLDLSDEVLMCRVSHE